MPRINRIGLLSAAIVAAGVGLTSTQASADWRRGHRYDGGAVAAGVIGGLALGAIAGGALAAPAPAYRYAPPPPYEPAPAYYARPPVVYEEPPIVCEIRREKVWLDSWTYEFRRVRVCN